MGKRSNTESFCLKLPLPHWFKKSTVVRRTFYLAALVFMLDLIVKPWNLSYTHTGVKAAVKSLSVASQNRDTTSQTAAANFLNLCRQQLVGILIEAPITIEINEHKTQHLDPGPDCKKYMYKHLKAPQDIDKWTIDRIAIDLDEAVQNVTMALYRRLGSNLTLPDEAAPVEVRQLRPPNQPLSTIAMIFIFGAIVGTGAIICYAAARYVRYRRLQSSKPKGIDHIISWFWFCALVCVPLSTIIGTLIALYVFWSAQNASWTASYDFLKQYKALQVRTYCDEITSD